FSYSRNILFTPSTRTNASDYAHNFIRDHYNSSVEEGFIVVEYWQDGHLNIISIFFLLSVVSRFLLELLFCSILARRTHLGILSSSCISENQRSIQLNILHTVIAQMMIPCVCLYTPLLFILLSPLLGVPSYSLSCLFVGLASCYQVWDAAAIIVLIKDYREGLYTMIRGTASVSTEISINSTKVT
ncbi:hypothetical protein PMAYCL1PPCAC_32722, partial [Pristionchus mayeri]